MKNANLMQLFILIIVSSTFIQWRSMCCCNPVRRVSSPTRSVISPTGLGAGSVIMPHHSKQGPRNVDISQDVE